MSDPEWYKDAIIYELRTRSFFDSNGDGVGDLAGLTAKLDYLKDLGVSALWLLPHYPSPQRDDGYDIADYLSVHPALGTIDDFRELLLQAHARGLKVITELVLNHTSDQHPWFERARRAPPGSRERNYYVWTDDPSKWSEARIIFQDYEVANWTWDPVAKQYYWHRFFSHQPDLNFESPDVQEAMLGAVDFWFSLGVDGLRLDAVPYLYEREGTTCENLPETHAFLRKLRAHVDARFEDRMLLAEANQWPEDAVAYFGAGDECHMAFHFPIMPRLFMALRMEDSYPISDILEQTPPVPESCQWALFLRNHDELTLEMVTDEERDFMVARYAADEQTRINLGIRRRLAPLLENDRRRIELMQLLLLSLPGTPVLYYGDEIGMGDNPYLGDRDGVRTPMQWSPDRNGGFSRANPQRLILPTIIDPEYSYETVNVEVQGANPSSLLWWMKRMIGLRRQHAAFGRGSLHLLAPENRKVLAFLRRHGSETLLVVVNLSRYPQWVELELGEFAGTVPVELVGNGAFPPIEARPYRLTLGGHDALWFSLSSSLERRRGSLQQPPQLAPSTYVGTWQGLLAAGSPLEGVLAVHIPAQRWYRSKTRSVLECHLVDVIPLPSEGLAQGPASSRLLAFARLELSDGDPETYVLPLSLVDGTEPPPGALVGLCEEGEAAPRRFLCDATLAPETALGLQAIAFGEQRVRGRTFSLRGHRSATAQRASADGVKPLGAEQSNSSYLFGQQLVGKLLRRVEQGTSLEVDVLQALQLAEKRPNVPSLEARIDVEQGGEVGTLWVSETFVQNEGDAWQVAVDHAQRFYESVLAERQGREPPPRPPGLFEALGDTTSTDFVPLARLLGKRTAELHAALFVSFHGELGPKPFTSLSSRAFYQSVRNLNARAFDALKHATLAPPAQRLAEGLLERKAGLRRLVDRALARPLAGQRMRVHGDYHLGQVLYTGSDFFIIDFEGEPARSMSERRRLRSPLADVAGMIRSIHYAAFGVLSMQLPGTQIRPEDRELLEPWARHFADAAVRAFLTGYTRAAEGEPFLPRPEELAPLLEIHLVEKALYELAYELDNRPNWVELPLRGLLELVDG